MKRSIQKALIVAAAIGLLSGCASFTEHRTGVVAGKLTPCPAWPRCRSSDETDQEKVINSLKIPAGMDAKAFWNAAELAVRNLPRSKIIQSENGYLHAEITSPWHFYTDDLELLMRADQQEIAIRSSGRIGYFDFHVNRDRIEAVRSEIKKLLRAK